MCYVRNNYDNTWYSLSRNKEGAKQWGKYNIPIYTDKDCTNTKLVRILAHYFGIDKSRIYAHGRISKKDINMTEGVHLLEYILRKWQ